MTLKQHLSLTTPLALLALPFLEDPLCALFFWIGGVLIDIDHSIEYVWEKRKFPVSLAAIESFFYNLELKKLYCVFHSYELLVALLAINFFFVQSSYGYSLILGCLLHLITDSLTNQVHWKSYFLFYRLKHAFALGKMLKKELR